MKKNIPRKIHLSNGLCIRTLHSRFKQSGNNKMILEYFFPNVTLLEGIAQPPHIPSQDNHALETCPIDLPMVLALSCLLIEVPREKSSSLSPSFKLLNLLDSRRIPVTKALELPLVLEKAIAFLAVLLLAVNKGLINKLLCGGILGQIMCDCNRLIRGEMTAFFLDLLNRCISNRIRLHNLRYPDSLRDSQSTLKIFMPKSFNLEQKYGTHS